jgi:hypothetical protein
MSLTRIQRGMLGTASVIVSQNIDATGTPDGTTFLRGDGQWVAISGGGILSASTGIAFTTSSGGIGIWWNAPDFKINDTGLAVPSTITRIGRDESVGSNSYYYQKKGSIHLGSYYADGLGIYSTATINENAVIVGHVEADNYAAGDPPWGPTTIWGANSVSLGYKARAQGESGVAIGDEARVPGNFGVALGDLSTAYQNGVAIGQLTDAGPGSIAIGYLANNETGTNAIAIGQEAGRNASPGNYAINIGYRAGYGGSPEKTTIINATGNDLAVTQANAFFVAPVRGEVESNYAMYYNTSTHEVTYSNKLNLNFGRIVN